MEKIKEIAAVVVTYNRKELLKHCLDALLEQTVKPTVVYVVDNASTDGTMQSVKDWGFYECSNCGIQFKYVLNSKNEGGAGGFYLGMKTAFDDGQYAGIWVMDDDGVPAPTCLEVLLGFLGQYDFISPMVLSITDRTKAAFGDEKYDDIKKQATEGVIVNGSSLFNGTLLSRKLIEKVGFPKKEMFIWGDEMNYEFRCVNSGFVSITCVDAIHYHPDNRQQKIKTLTGRLISITDVDWKLFYLVRNQTYNSLFVAPGSKFKHLIGAFDNFLFYLYYFTFKKPGKAKVVNKAFFCAIRKDFRSYKEVMGID